MCYTVVDFNRYVEMTLSICEANQMSVDTISQLRQSWDGLRKGYNFVIAVGVPEQPMFYSVPYFNEHILGGECNGQ
jgi:hypothetical protein